MQDDFTGTTIDTAKWNITAPDNRFSQNNAFIITNPHTTSLTAWANTLDSVSNVSSGVAVVQSNMDWGLQSNNPNLNGIGLWKNSSNWIMLFTGGASNNEFRLIEYVGGSTLYDLNTGITNGNDVKIWTDGSTIKAYYWNGSAWVQMGITKTGSLGYNLQARIVLYNDNNAYNSANTATFDNLYFSNEDYSTHYPASSAPANTNFFQMFFFK